ncbi:MAG TPA: lipopolysaccharide assembly protein LapA domain-containing protein [Acidimicrobiales bacterium]|nr:lipopolysaccharide assembly protein LapA domain-containing protein [Acidimicrobiales bacterium]
MAYDPGGSGTPMEGPGGGVDPRRVARLVVVAVVAVLAVVFMAQNNDEVELNFLTLSVTSRLWVGLLVTLLLGAILGRAASALWTRRHQRGVDR